jgi:hypothetical protein
VVESEHKQVNNALFIIKPKQPEQIRQQIYDKIKRRIEIKHLVEASKNITVDRELTALEKKE